MAFYTELFVRPRPGDEPRRVARLAMVQSVSHGDRVQIAEPPADFPRCLRIFAGVPRPLRAGDR